MRRSTHSPNPSPEKDIDSASDELTKQHPYTTNFDNTHGYFEDAVHGLNDWIALHDFHDCQNHLVGDANEDSQSKRPNIRLDTNASTAHELHSAVQESRLASEGNKDLSHGMENCIELTHPNVPSHRLASDSSQAYLMRRISCSIEEPPFLPMPLIQLSPSRDSSAPPHMSSHHYGPFLGRFQTSADAKTYRREKMRFNRGPWRDPDSDPTIAETENNRNLHVERIYNAMICGDFARDNAKSTALKRWVHEPHYQSDLVEAYAHKVFDCLLEQVTKGFRGWGQNDYVNDERKGEDDDKDIDCAGRLDNIIAALQQEKSICENVMSSAWQIRMFVNAPKAYAKRKDQNRVGNSKRPNAKSNGLTENEPRSLKRRRNTAVMGTKQVRNRSVIPEARSSRCLNTQQQYRRQYQSATRNSVEAMLALQVPFAHFPPCLQEVSSAHKASIALPPTPSSLRTPQNPQGGAQNTTPTSAVQQPLFSPSPISPSHYTESHPPSVMGSAIMPQSFREWHGTAHSDHSLGTPQQPDTVDYTMVTNRQQDVQPFASCDAPTYTSVFEHHPDMGIRLTNTNLISTHAIEDDLDDDVFHGYWEQAHLDM